MVNRRIKFLSIALTVVALQGCLPRGETHTLDQVLKDARSQYASVDKKGIPSDLSPSVDRLATLLQEIGDASDVNSLGAKTKEVSGILASLTLRAGYTSRPSLGELASQYRTFSIGGDETRAKAKLLVARTYSLIAGELQTTKFGV